jgi:hypothetical protein
MPMLPGSGVSPHISLYFPLLGGGRGWWTLNVEFRISRALVVWVASEYFHGIISDDILRYKLSA